MNKKALESFITNFDFISSRIKYSYNNDFEINIKMIDDETISGLINIRLGIGETELISFITRIKQSNEIITFKSKYHYEDYRAKTKPHFMGTGEYTTKSEGPSCEEKDTFIVITRPKKSLLDFPKKYLIHLVNDIPFTIYEINKNFKLCNGINGELTHYSLENQELEMQYSQIEDFVNRKK